MFHTRAIFRHLHFGHPGILSLAPNNVRVPLKTCGGNKRKALLLPPPPPPLPEGDPLSVVVAVVVLMLLCRRPFLTYTLLSRMNIVQGDNFGLSFGWVYFALVVALSAWKGGNQAELAVQQEDTMVEHPNQSQPNHVTKHSCHPVTL